MLKAADIRGVIIDKSNQEPLIGATVIESGTNNGAVSDLDGNYSLEVAEDASILVQSIGFAKQRRCF